MHLNLRQRMTCYLHLLCNFQFWFFYLCISTRSCYVFLNIYFNQIFLQPDSLFLQLPLQYLSNRETLHDDPKLNLSEHEP